MGNSTERTTRFLDTFSKARDKLRSRSRSSTSSSEQRPDRSRGASKPGKLGSDTQRYSRSDIVVPQVLPAKTSEQTDEGRKSTTSEDNRNLAHHEAANVGGFAAADMQSNKPERVRQEPVTAPVKDHGAKSVAEENQTTTPQIQISQPAQLPTSSCVAVDQPQVPRATTQLKDDLWQQAYNLLSDEEKKGLSALHSREDTPAGDESQFGRKMVNDAVEMTRKKQEQCEEEAWRVSINGKDGGDIILRDKAAVVIDWLTKAGNIGAGFAPSLVQQVWPCVKGLLQIPVAAAKQMQALLQVASSVARVIARGYVYEGSYDENNTPADALTPLRQSLVDLYKGALQLLSQAGELLDQNALTRAIKAVLDPDVIKSASENLSALEKQLNLDVQAAQVVSSNQAYEKLRHALEILDRPVLRTDENVRKLLIKFKKEEEITELEWLSRMNHDDRYVKTVEDMLDHTCEWILNHEKFQEWECSNGSALIWLQGSSGTGKTYLTTKVIQRKDELLNKAGTHDEGLAFFYFNRSIATSSTAISCLRSLLRQLSRPYSHGEYMRKSLSERIAQWRIKGHGGPSLGFCREELLTSANLFPRTTIIIDALDECDTGDRKILVKTLSELVRCSVRPLKIFISGRPDMDFGAAFLDRTTVTIGVEDNQEDIARLVRTRMEEWRWDENLKQRVIKVLLEKSQGMFRWTALQIDHILEIEVKQDINEALEQLPEGLEGAYDAICERQMDLKLGKTRAAIAKRAIMWVMAAKQPLESPDLLSAVRLNPVNFIETMVRSRKQGTILLGEIRPLLEPQRVACTYVDDEITEETLLRLCANLLTINSSTRCWEFCHASVSEYFERRHFRALQAHSHLGASSLMLCIDLHRSAELKLRVGAATCLSQGEAKYEKRVSWSDYSRGGFHMRPYFVQYCIEYWARHFHFVDKLLGQGCVGPSELQEKYVDVTVPVKALGNLLRSFLGHPLEPSPEYKSWMRASYSHSRAQVSVWKTMARYDLFHLLRDWWDNFEFRHESETYPADDHTQLAARDRANLFDYACRRGMVKMGKLLLDASTSLKESDEAHFFTSACIHDDMEMVKFLLEVGTSPGGAREERAIHHLSTVAHWGKVEMCKLLVETGQFDLDWPADTMHNPLCGAVNTHNLDLLQYLISAGADTNIPLRDGHGGVAGSPLAYAASLGRVTAMRIMVEKGRADPNLVMPSGDTVAICAAYHHRFGALEYLICNFKINPNAYMPDDAMYGSILIAALHSTKVLDPDKLRCLAGLGVDLCGFYRPTNDSDAFLDCGSPLEVLARAGNVEAIECLIEEYDADINQISSRGRYGSALIAAICITEDQYLDEFIRQYVVRYLLEAGADVNLQVRQGKHHSPLAAAIDFADDNVDMVQELINQGADVNMELIHSRSRSALMLAASMGKKDVVQLLIDEGADVHRQENEGWEKLLQSRCNTEDTDKEADESDQFYHSVGIEIVSTYGDSD